MVVLKQKLRFIFFFGKILIKVLFKKTQERESSRGRVGRGIRKNFPASSPGIVQRKTLLAKV